ncbi:unnamed protein product, partial [Mesorhabditis spiculigera]
MRVGRVMHRWVTKKCILYNGTLRIEHEMEEDEVLIVARYRIEVLETRRGKVLRLSNENSSTWLLFENLETLNLWLARCQQWEVSPTCDLSDQRLVLIPDAVFSAAHVAQITSLNLRKNSLQFRSIHQEQLGISGAWSRPPLGWIEDLARLTALTHLDLSSNRLCLFPLPLIQLPNLSRLSLSGNQIEVVPVEIRALSGLTELDLSNNWLETLPSQIGECLRLGQLNLAFNRFSRIPTILRLLRAVTHWKLAGNSITDLSNEEIDNCTRLDLRRNKLTGSIRVPQSTESLRSIDLRDNAIKSLHITNCSNLQTLHCGRNHLSELHINGTSLTYLNAAKNHLSTVIIMPIPIRLAYFSVADNRFAHLPNWVSDLPHIDTIDVHKNQLIQLPEKIFRIPSLRHLLAHTNRLTYLPEEVENCQIENLDLHHNALEGLPKLLFRSSHRLRTVNLSANILRELPSPNPLPDLNRIQILKAAMNELDDRVISTISSMRRLKTLDLSDNHIRVFDDSALCTLTALEELNLSTNRLTSLSSLITALPALQILRVHSNHLTHLPDLTHSSNLKILDVCSNRLSHAQLSNCMAERLKQLDLSCNPALPSHLITPSSHETKSPRPMALLDVGGFAEQGLVVGFSQSSGQRNRLSVRQILPLKRHVSPIFAIVDAAGSSEMAIEILDHLHRVAETQEVVDEGTLKNWILSAHEWIGDSGERVGAMSPQPVNQQVYEQLRAANAILDEENLVNGVSRYDRQVGFTAFFPAILPRANTASCTLTTPEDFIVIGSRALGETLSEPFIENIISGSSNPQVTAKRLQDAIQAFEWNDNVSIIVAKPARETGEVTFRRGNEYGTIRRPEISELTLQKIEERIEQISKVIAKIEDENDETKPTPVSGIRKTHEKSGDSRLNTGPPPDPAIFHRTRREENDDSRNRWLLLGSSTSKTIGRGSIRDKPGAKAFDIA